MTITEARAVSIIKNERAVQVAPALAVEFERLRSEIRDHRAKLPPGSCKRNCGGKGAPARSKSSAVSIIRSLPSDQLKSLKTLYATKKFVFFYRDGNNEVQRSEI